MDDENNGFWMFMLILVLVGISFHGCMQGFELRKQTAILEQLQQESEQ